MQRTEIINYITDTYDAAPEFLWHSTPSYAVFRHTLGQKWFAAVMDVPRARLGLTGAGSVNILNVKCDPEALGAFQKFPGILPAYHMNKKHWLTVLLDGTVPEETVHSLLDMSFRLTAAKPKKTSAAK